MRLVPIISNTSRIDNNNRHIGNSKKRRSSSHHQLPVVDVPAEVLAPLALGHEVGMPADVVDGAFSRDSRSAEEERGSVVVTVLVVREVAADAESAAVAAELAVRRADWEPYADAGTYRIVGIDTTAPAFKERDSSGRYVWTFDVACTVVRAL